MDVVDEATCLIKSIEISPAVATRPFIVSVDNKEMVALVATAEIK